MRATRVDRSRKAYLCDNCLGCIRKGESYLWWQPVGKEVIRWHEHHGKPPMSLVTTGYISDAYKQKEAVMNILDLTKRAAGKLDTKQLNRDNQMNFYEVHFDNTFSIAIHTLEDIVEYCEERAEAINECLGENQAWALHTKTAISLKDWIKTMTDVRESWFRTVGLLYHPHNRRMNTEIKKTTFLGYLRSCEEIIERLEL